MKLMIYLTIIAVLASFSPLPVIAVILFGIFIVLAEIRDQLKDLDP